MNVDVSNKIQSLCHSVSNWWSLLLLCATLKIPSQENFTIARRLCGDCGGWKIHESSFTWNADEMVHKLRCIYEIQAIADAPKLNHPMIHHFHSKLWMLKQHKYVSCVLISNDLVRNFCNIHCWASLRFQDDIFVYYIQGTELRTEPRFEYTKNVLFCVHAHIHSGWKHSTFWLETLQRNNKISWSIDSNIQSMECMWMNSNMNLLLRFHSPANAL